MGRRSKGTVDHLGWVWLCKLFYDQPQKRKHYPTQRDDPSERGDSAHYNKGRSEKSRRPYARAGGRRHGGHCFSSIVHDVPSNLVWAAETAIRFDGSLYCELDLGLPSVH